ncbi:putative bifunctional diguanylate cyclase/phosphodiesterase [Deinococcus ruber]|uniref:Diguanylate cyclase n=1 Tax=Deinococcus ruber TaxID=1848197 RepID=A0A918CMV8_9DEIO|nr:bifunctional diguanylate cyclase/phosphodiesterase [Deinococcus ruber]GGR32900.1 hypothetical protein GCM10008957_49110 [Deinococcus ruber]
MAAAAFDSTVALIVVLDRAGQIVRFNAACERLSGYHERDVLGQVLWPLVLDPPTAHWAAAAFANLTPGQPLSTYQNDWLTATGEHRHIMWETTYLLDAAGDIDLVVATGIDLTEEHRTQHEQQESEARFRALFDRSADGVVLIDPHDPLIPWRIVDCNAAFARMNGYPPERLIGHSIDLLHETPLMATQGPQLLTWIRTQGEHARGEGTHRHADGRVFPIESSSCVITLGGRELVLGIDRDISERKHAQAQLQALNERLAHDASHDVLTGLPNRAMLLERLDTELRRAARSETAVAVMFVDLDGFKHVNDTLGHAAGDTVLRTVATRLQCLLRPSDTVARVGGDEFVVVLPDMNMAHDAARVAQRLQAEVSRPMPIQGMDITINCSIGISVSPQDGHDVDTLLRHADLAMYDIKKAGKHAVCFYEPIMNAEAQARLQTETRLRAAIMRQTLTVHYQPQVDVISGHWLGLEALARWTDADLGVVSPDEFIPVAEETGLIMPLGAWVLNEACRQAAAWTLRVPMAVNVSPLQIVHPEFVDIVAQALDRYGMSPQLLKLEVTERLGLHESVLAAESMGRLRSLGVTLSLDDFGAGQSAVASLLELAFQEVKLDRSLLANVTDDPASWQVLGALLALARGLNLSVVMEGVETPLQLHVVRTLGCTVAQGYLTGCPSPPTEMAQLLAFGSATRPAN